MEISIIIICLILSAFFSGMEIAFISSNKIYLEIEKKQDSFPSQILTRLTEKPSQFIATMLIGNSLALVIYGFFMGELLLQWVASYGYHFGQGATLVLQIFITSFFAIVTAEFLPKVFFQIYANSLIKVLAVPAYMFYLLFYYVAMFMIWISDVILRKIFKSENGEVPLFFSKAELGNYITEQMKAVEDYEIVDSEIQIFQNALEFSGVRARDIMTPRTEISAVEIEDSVDNLRAMFIQTGYSKMLVFQDSLDDMIGYVHSFELFKKPKSIKKALIPVEFVPETIFIKEVLDQLIKTRKSIAVVLDEHGGTAGIISIEDIVEELFGEIEDEHDSEETALMEKEIEEGVFLFSARLDVGYLNQTYKLGIPENDSYGTLGGFIVDFTKEIPRKGMEITIGDYLFHIEEATNKKIELVKMTMRN